AIEMSDTSRQTLVRVVLWSTGLASLVLLGRYFFITREGQSDVPAEFAYAHESVLFLVAGIAIGAGVWMAGGSSRRWVLPLHSLLLLSAILATGRRSGTLVVLVMGIILLALLIKRRPLA